MRAPSSRMARGTAAVLLTLLGVAGLSGCADYWTPVATEQGGDDRESAATGVQSEPVLQTAASFPAAWNAVADANGSSIVVPDVLVPDDVAGDAGSVTLVIEDDYTLIMTWSAVDGSITFVELDGPGTPEDIEGADLAIAAESLVSATSGVTGAEAKTVIADLLASVEIDPADPTNASSSVTLEIGTLTFSSYDGLSSFIITPGE